MHQGTDGWTRTSQALDQRVLSMTARQLRPPVAAAPYAPSDEQAILVAAISAAALAAAEFFPADLPMALRKSSIDGAATRAAEAVFNRSALRIRVTGGEGQRDSSPGAFSGQILGRPAGTGQVLDGIFDYVDGTTLAALGEPGALALGGFGVGLRSVPDLQAYLVLAPKTVLPELEVMTPPEEHAVAALRHIAAAVDKPVGDLTVFTHAHGEKSLHQTLIERLRSVTQQVVTQARVTVEPPYLLTLADLGQPRIDTMIGAIGFSELAFAALLLDLIAPDYGFVFRVGSMAGQRNQPTALTLDPMFEFSSGERDELAAHGWCTDRQYTSGDIVPPGSARAAAIFAVTDEPVLGLSGVASRPATNGWRTQGLLMEPCGLTSKIDVDYR